MTDEEIRQFVHASRVGVLSLASGNRAYAVPLFYAFDGRQFYFHGRPGLKEMFAQRTHEACLCIVAAQSEDVWTSVLAFGPVHEITADPEMLAAQDALLAVPVPPAWGFSELGEPRRTEKGTRAWGLVPTRLTGRKSVRPLGEAQAPRHRQGSPSRTS